MIKIDVGGSVARLSQVSEFDIHNIVDGDLHLTFAFSDGLHNQTKKYIRFGKGSRDLFSMDIVSGFVVAVELILYSKTVEIVVGSEAKKAGRLVGHPRLAVEGLDMEGGAEFVDVPSDFSLRTSGDDLWVLVSRERAYRCICLGDKLCVEADSENNLVSIGILGIPDHCARLANVYGTSQ